MWQLFYYGNNEGCGGAGKYEQGAFQSKTAMPRVAKELEVFVDKYVSYDCYISETGHRNISFDYEAVLRKCLLAMSLLYKPECYSVSVCFTLDFQRSAAQPKEATS